MEKPQTWLTNLIVKNTSKSGKLQMCFCIVYLLKIIANIIKANTIIVSTTNPNKSKYIISNKIASIICTTSILAIEIADKSGKPHLLFLISYAKYYTIQ